MVPLDETTQEYKFFKKVYQDMDVTGITDKNEAFKRACGDLMMIWTSK